MCHILYMLCNFIQKMLAGFDKQCKTLQVATSGNLHGFLSLLSGTSSDGDPVDAQVCVRCVNVWVFCMIHSLPNGCDK